MSVLGWIGGTASALAVGGALGWVSQEARYSNFGLGDTAHVIRRAVVPDRQTIHVGGWSTSLATGGTNADMFTRAQVARTGLLALNRSETLYFNATHDDSGLPLEARCRYEVTGEAPAAKWWSLTVYADDHFLVPDPSNRYSISLKDAAGPFKLLLSPDKRDGLWLPTGESGGFSLLLRLYNPAPESAKNPASTRLPKITRTGGCR
jgi:hypothetical protein